MSTVAVRKPALAVQTDNMVYMDVSSPEISKQPLRRLGVNWAGATNGGSTRRSA